jgi:hypothetical protein
MYHCQKKVITKATSLINPEQARRTLPKPFILGGKA